MIPALADVTLSPNEIGIAAVGFIITLLTYHAVVSKYIREQAGVKDTQRVEIAGQPMTMRTEVNFVPTGEFRLFEKRVQNELHELHQMMEVRRKEVAGQHEQSQAKLDQKFSEAIKANNVSASKIHERIEATTESLRLEIDNKVGGVRAELGTMPNRIVELLKSTGAIGQAPRRA